MEWREVSEDEFYDAIGPQNVSPMIVRGSFPYTSVFVTPDGQQRGKAIDYRTAGGGTIEKRYMLPNT